MTHRRPKVTNEVSLMGLIIYLLTVVKLQSGGAQTKILIECFFYKDESGRQVVCLMAKNRR